jgi:hypothetical protein
MATITFNKKLGMLLLGVWLILMGAFDLFSLTFAGQKVVMGLLALVAGIILVIDR